MVEIIAQIGDYVVKKTKRDYLVYDIYLCVDEYHAHFKELKNAEKCIELILSGEKPISPRMRESVKRIVTEEQFQKLRDTEPSPKCNKHMRGKR